MCPFICKNNNKFKKKGIEGVLLYIGLDHGKLLKDKQVFQLLKQRLVL
jgi:hypothetical protein